MILAAVLAIGFQRTPRYAQRLVLETGDLSVADSHRLKTQNVQSGTAFSAILKGDPKSLIKDLDFRPWPNRKSKPTTLHADRSGFFRATLRPGIYRVDGQVVLRGKVYHGTGRIDITSGHDPVFLNDLNQPSSATNSGLGFKDAIQSGWREYAEVRYYCVASNFKRTGTDQSLPDTAGHAGEILPECKDLYLHVLGRLPNPFVKGKFTFKAHSAGPRMCIAVYFKSIGDASFTLDMITKPTPLPLTTEFRQIPQPHVPQTPSSATSVPKP